jgi:hypothetical protein
MTNRSLYDRLSWRLLFKLQWKHLTTTHTARCFSTSTVSSCHQSYHHPRMWFTTTTCATTTTNITPLVLQQQQQQQQLRRTMMSTASSSVEDPSVQASSAIPISSSSSPSSSSSVPLLNAEVTNDATTWSSNSEDCNVPIHIQQQIGRNLHLQPNHPLHILHSYICRYFNHHLVQQQEPQALPLPPPPEEAPNVLPLHNEETRNEPPQPQPQPPQRYTIFNQLSPIVSTRECFDELRIGPDHPSRSRSDTYYMQYDTVVLRPHTSAHQVAILRQSTPHPLTQFLITGDVYRRDEIDQSHYPIFHQMEGVNIMTKILPSSMTAADRNKYIEHDLKRTLEGLIQYLFNCSTTNSSSSNNRNHNNDTDTTPKIQMRWRDDHFLFTDPSYELDIWYNNQWMEVFGCGIIHDDIMKTAQRENEYGCHILWPKFPFYLLLLFLDRFTILFFCLFVCPYFCL